MNTPCVLLQGAILAFVGGLLVIALSNLFAFRRLGSDPQPGRQPRVSVLVPARNEEANIGRCVASLLAQDYPDLEVLALDDGSEDRTGAILAALAEQDPRLRVLVGRPLPEGWLGKNWACQQLTEASSGELLLFTDADTWHEPRSVAGGVAALMAEEADLLSAVPQQVCVSWAERLVVPAVTWGSCFLPFALAHRLRAPALSITIGQYMLFRRRAYEQIGGYAAIRDVVADDTVLGRTVKARGLRWRLVDGSAHVHCRMYHNLGEVFRGFGKSLFAGYGYNLPGFAAIWLWMALAFLGPLLTLLLHVLGAPIAPLCVRLAGAAVGGSLLLWGLSNWRSRFPPYLALLYPVTIALAVAIAAYSVGLVVLGRSTWKGRPLARQRLHFR